MIRTSADKIFVLRRLLPKSSRNSRNNRHFLQLSKSEMKFKKSREIKKNGEILSEKGI